MGDLMLVNRLRTRQQVNDVQSISMLLSLLDIKYCSPGLHDSYL